MGRAEKYANVVDDFEKEEKLSMTRELKFESLQKEIDDNVTIADAMELDNMSDTKEVRRLKNQVTETSEIQVEDVLDDTDILEMEDTEEIPEVEEQVDETPVPEPVEEIKEEVPKKKSKREEKIDKIIDEPTEELTEVSDDTDSIYLTSSFKPVKEKARLRKVFRVLFTLIFLTIVGCLLFVYVIKPVYKLLLTSNPENVFEQSINYLADKGTEIVDHFGKTGDYISFDLATEFESNAEEMNNMTGVKYSYSYITDLSNGNLSKTYGLVSGDRHSHEYRIENGILYEKYDTYDMYMLKNNVETKKSEDLLVTLFRDYDADTLKQFINSNKEIVLGYIKEDYLSKKSDVVEVNGKKIKATRNTLSFTSKELDMIKREIEQKKTNDNKYNEIYNLLVKEELKYDDKTTININIYIKSGKFIGFDIEKDGFRIAYMYYDGEDYIFHSNINDGLIDIESHVKDGKREMNIKHINKVVADLVIEKKEDNKYEIEYKNFKDYNGTLILDLDYDNRKYDFELTRSDTKEIIKMKGSLVYKTTKNNLKLNEDSITELSVTGEQEVENNFINSFNSETLYGNYVYWEKFINSFVEELYT